MALNGTQNYPGKGLLEYLQRHGVKFADATSGIELSPDCEHLTEKGHRQLADLFLHHGYTSYFHLQEVLAGYQN